ncbi:MAG: TonB-dependent receptor [Mucilaginibacter polytrichastri]|nr:TonB-dependent receptor [Mucilaginibacter polytrichastri]
MKNVFIKCALAFFCVLPVLAQAQKSVTVNVKDAQGPLPGASVMVKGTNNGQVTDANGKAVIKDVPANAQLTIQLISYKAQTITVGDQATINVTMESDQIKLKDVVVIGYGQQNRKDVTGAVTSIKSGDFNKGVNTNPLTLVEGRVPGLTVQTPNTDPNGSPQLNLRGTNTLSGSVAPLVVIDGVPGGNINNIAPEDIESIDVLKDASASSIYGTRGNNGVILITSKKGVGGQPTIDYSFQGYVEQITRLPKVLNREQYVQLNGTGNDFGATTNWFDAVTQQPFNMIHDLAFSGGSDKTNYRASVRYQDSKGILLNSGRDQLNLRLNLNQKAINDKVNLQLNLSNSYADAKFTNYNALEQAIVMNPTRPVYNEDGTFYEPPVGYNPVADLLQIQRGSKYQYLQGNLKADVDIVEGLKGSVTIAAERINEQNDNYTPKESRPQYNGGLGNASRLVNYNLNKQLDATLNYTKQFGDHNLTILGGYSYQDFDYNNFSAGNQNFLTDAFGVYNLGAGLFLQSGQATMGSTRNKSALVAGFARALYSYKDKYLLNATFRREGSTKFGRNNKWASFPGVSAGWRISKEDFLADSKWINDIKIRAAFGVTGQQNIDPYTSLFLYSPGANYPYGVTPEGLAYTRTYGPLIDRVPNPNLKWEENREINFGVDFAFLDNRLTGSLDYYNRRTSNLLFNYPTQVPSAPAPNIFTNVGVIDNQGYEVAITGIPVQQKDYSYQVTFTGSYNTNVVSKLSSDIYQATYISTGGLPAPGNLGDAYRIEEGKPIGNFYGKRFAGFTPDGDWLFYNRNGEQVTAGQIQQDDFAVLGNGNPRYNLGLNNVFRYKNFDLTLFFKGQLGFDILNVREIYYGNRKTLPNNVFASALDFPDINDIQYSDYYLEKGDYLKLSTAALGYTFKIPGSKIIKSARATLSAQNLFVITGYKGLDPELRAADDRLQLPGYDGESSNGSTGGRGFYPRTRIFNIGVSASF